MENVEWANLQKNLEHVKSKFFLQQHGQEVRTNKGSYTTYCEFRINQTGEKKNEKKKKTQS